MIKKITLCLGLISSFATLAQEGSASPYSFYGLGDPKSKGTAETRAMAGIGVIPDSTHVVLQNPAANAHLKLTVISVGGNSNFTNMKNDNSSENSKRTTLDYLAIGIPMGKFGATFGLNTETAVGYKINNIQENGNEYNFNGEGGVNRVFLGLGYKATSKLSLGIQANYNFGNIKHQTKFYEFDVHYGTRIINQTEVNGINLNLGAVYQSKINKYDVFASATYAPEFKLKTVNDINIATLNISNNTETIVDTHNYPRSNKKINLPGKYSIGLGFGELKKWMIATEVTLQDKNEDLLQTNNFSNVTYNKASKYSLGGYYIPKYNSFTNYMNRVTYRAGFKFEETGMVINNEKINDLGVSLGLSLPVGNRFSDISITAEYGKRGTTNSGLIQENYFNLNIGITISDKWFRKVLYD